MKSIFDLVGRMIIGLVSIFEAIDSIVFFEETKETLLAYNLDKSLNVLIVGSILLLLIGGILVLIGYNANVGAFLLILYWIPYILIVYSFWNDPPDLQRVNMLNFMRLLAYVGGLAVIVANGGGKYSIKRLFHVLRLPS